MMQKPQATILPRGRRLHLHHGPIDLIIKATGDGWQQSYRQARLRFETILDELVGELEMLRHPCEAGRQFKGPVAQNMQLSVEQFLPLFITPMAAVAGAVADEILDAMVKHTRLDKIYVNNGGDSAIFLAEGQSINAAIAARFAASIAIHSSDPHRGIATSGWRGRSQSFGIADSVSVVARNAAIADAAATMIANCIDLPGHKAITRQRADEIQPDSDLGDRLITTGVGVLSDEEINCALDGGYRLAEQYHECGLIGGVMLVLGDHVRQIGTPDLITVQNGEPADA
ncbi:MAG: UPF0280 family protein [Rhizobiaceae bacterium]|nr:UPF0280 family protein [Rhizobiaceae bacterium]